MPATGRTSEASRCIHATRRSSKGRFHSRLVARRLPHVLALAGAVLRGRAGWGAARCVPPTSNIDHGVFLLHARVEYPVSPAIRDALRDGVTLTFDLEARVERERRFWFNANIVDLTLRRELAYHTVSDRYVVRDAESGDQETFATLEEALDYLGKVTAGRSWWSRSSTGATTRSACAPACAAASLPASLRALLFWTDDWARQSEWYTWSLPV